MNDLTKHWLITVQLCVAAYVCISVLSVSQSVSQSVSRCVMHSLYQSVNLALTQALNQSINHSVCCFHVVPSCSASPSSCGDGGTPSNPQFPAVKQ